jgi:hypothetical protein
VIAEGKGKDRLVAVLLVASLGRLAADQTVVQAI